jgi:hypothetical protein
VIVVAEKQAFPEEESSSDFLRMQDAISGGAINEERVSPRYYGSKRVPPNGAISLEITLNEDQVAGLLQLQEEHNLKSLDPLFHLAVREFLRAEGILWHEGRLRISIHEYGL